MPYYYYRNGKDLFKFKSPQKNTKYEEISEEEWNAEFAKKAKIIEHYSDALDLSSTKEIERIKAKLAETDYIAIKYAEGVISEEEYGPTKAQRQAWRQRINDLEKGL